MPKILSMVFLRAMLLAAGNSEGSDTQLLMISTLSSSPTGPAGAPMPMKVTPSANRTAAITTISVKKDEDSGGFKAFFSAMPYSDDYLTSSVVGDNCNAWAYVGGDQRSCYGDMTNEYRWCRIQYSNRPSLFNIEFSFCQPVSLVDIKIGTPHAGHNILSGKLQYRNSAGVWVDAADGAQVSQRSFWPWWNHECRGWSITNTQGTSTRWRVYNYYGAGNQYISGFEMSYSPSIPAPTATPTPSPTAHPTPAPTASTLSSSPTVPAGAPMPMNLQKTMVKFSRELWVVDSAGCLRSWTSWYYVRAESGKFGACEQGWPIAAMKSLEGSQFLGVVVLTKSGGIYCKSATYCTDSVNEHGVGKVPYPNQASDPAVQVAVGPENMLLVTASGKVMVMGQTRFEVVQPIFNGVSLGTTVTEMKPVFGLPDPGVNPAVQVGIKNGYGGYSAGVLTASGELWSWGQRATRFGFPSASNSEVPRRLQGLPSDDGFIIDFMMGGYHFYLLRTSRNKVYGGGSTHSGASGCQNGWGPCEITDRIPGLDTDPVSHYMAAYYASWIVLKSGKIYTLGTDDKCGARGLGSNSGQDGGSYHPNPELVTSSLPSGDSAVELGGDVNAPYAVLMTSGKIYVWGWYSTQEKTCVLRDHTVAGTPLPRLVDNITALLPGPPATFKSNAVAAKGDPHLQNVYGQRFDLMQPGIHVLLHIPKGVLKDAMLLDVSAEAARVGTACADMYFQTLNITGIWADRLMPGGVGFSASQKPNDAMMSVWLPFGQLRLKVVRGRVINQNTHYLNIYAKHLDRVNAPIGGLLGEDDHSAAATSDCRKRAFQL